jgi:hypothetical protein
MGAELICFHRALALAGVSWARKENPPAMASGGGICAAHGVQPAESERVSSCYRIVYQLPQVPRWANLCESRYCRLTLPRMKEPHILPYQGLPAAWRRDVGAPPRMTAQAQLTQTSVQEEPCFRIFHHPGQAVLEILARHGATSQDLPPVRSNRLQLQSLQYLLLVHASLNVRLVREHEEAGAREPLFNPVVSTSTPCRRPRRQTSS